MSSKYIKSTPLKVYKNLKGGKKLKKKKEGTEKIRVLGTKKREEEG